VSNAPQSELSVAESPRTSVTGKGTLLLGVGPGRSGTSLAAVALRTLGAHVPQPELAPNDMNPSGFGEAKYLTRFNKGVLRQADVLNIDARPTAPSELLPAVYSTEPLLRALGWMVNQLDQVDTVMLKDPRLPWTLDLWTEVAALSGRKAEILRLVREPQSVVASILRWSQNNRTADYLLGGWINLNRNIDVFHGRLPMHILEHGKLVDGLETYMTSLVDSMQADGFALGLDPRGRSLDHLVDPNRSHSSGSSGSSRKKGAEATTQLQAIAAGVYRSLLDEASGGQEPAAALAQRTELYAEYDELYAAADRLVHGSQQVVVRAERGKLRERNRLLRERNQRIAELEVQLGGRSGAPARSGKARAASSGADAVRPGNGDSLARRLGGALKSLSPGLYAKLRTRYVGMRGGK